MFYKIINFDLFTLILNKIDIIYKISNKNVRRQIEDYLKFKNKIENDII